MLRSTPRVKASADGSRHSSPLAYVEFAAVHLDPHSEHARRLDRRIGDLR